MQAPVFEPDDLSIVDSHDVGNAGSVDDHRNVVPIIDDHSRYRILASLGCVLFCSALRPVRLSTDWAVSCSDRSLNNQRQTDR